MKQHHTKRRRQKERPEGYCRDYERRRKNGGKRFKERFKAILRRITKFLEDNPEHKAILCVLMAWVMMKKYSFSSVSTSLSASFCQISTPPSAGRGRLTGGSS